MADERDLGERVRALEVQMAAANGDIADIHREIYGPPRDDSVKGRLHVLENSEAVLKLAQQLVRERGQRAWTVREKVFAAAISLVVAASPWAMFFLSARRHG